MEKHGSAEENSAHKLAEIRKAIKQNAIIHHSKKTIYFVLEIVSYLIMIAIILVAIFFPTEIVFYWLGSNIYKISEKEFGEDLILVSYCLKVILIIISLFPLAIGILLRKLRKKNNVLRMVQELTK